MEKINIKLDSLEDATNKFNNEVLNEELANYITSSCLHSLQKERITLSIKGLPNINHQEQLSKLIHSHYQSKVKQLNKIDKYDDYFRVILLLLGILLIIISEQFTSLLSELFLIAGWVVVWEIAYDILFTSIKRKRDLKLYKKLATCEIEFFN